MSNFENQIFIEWQKEIDNAILGEIKQKAIENGIETKYILNEKAIISALKKQIPKKPLNPCGRYGGLAKGGNCPICGSHTNSSTYNYCRKCGQALDWGDGE